MASQRETEAQEYLHKHQILELMENLMSLVLFHRPEKPLQFLSEQLEALRSCRRGGVRGPALFTNDDLDTVFSILDPAHRRHVSFDQYHHALQTLGVRSINQCPDGVNEDRISEDVFRTEAREGLQRSSETFDKSSA